MLIKVVSRNLFALDMIYVNGIIFFIRMTLSNLSLNLFQQQILGKKLFKVEKITWFSLSEL